MAHRIRRVTAAKRWASTVTATAGSQSPLNGTVLLQRPSCRLRLTSRRTARTFPILAVTATRRSIRTSISSPNSNQASNFSAENQKGPHVISSVTKSGGSRVPRLRFFSARELCPERQRRSVQCHHDQSRPQDKYYYPGGTIGGPVSIPGTRFNKNHNKLFFFTGFEYFYQVLDTGLLAPPCPRRANSPATSPRLK